MAKRGPIRAARLRSVSAVLCVPFLMVSCRGQQLSRAATPSRRRYLLSLLILSPTAEKHRDRGSPADQWGREGKMGPPCDDCHAHCCSANVAARSDRTMMRSRQTITSNPRTSCRKLSSWADRSVRVPLDWMAYLEGGAACQPPSLRHARHSTHVRCKMLAATLNLPQPQSTHLPSSAYPISFLPRCLPPANGALSRCKNPYRILPRVEPPSAQNTQLTGTQKAREHSRRALANGLFGTPFRQRPIALLLAFTASWPPGRIPWSRRD